MSGHIYLLLRDIYKKLNHHLEKIQRDLRPDRYTRGFSQTDTPLYSYQSLVSAIAVVPSRDKKPQYTHLQHNAAHNKQEKIEKQGHS